MQASHSVAEFLLGGRDMVFIEYRNARLLGLFVVGILCSFFGSTGYCARTVTLLWDANSETNIAVISACHTQT